MPRAPGCWHGGPGVLGTTNTLPKNGAKKPANGISVSLLSPLLWIAQRQRWWSTVPPPHPSASGAPIPLASLLGDQGGGSPDLDPVPHFVPPAWSHNPYWARAWKQEDPTWGCAPLPSTLHSPGRLHVVQAHFQPLHGAPAQASGLALLEIMRPSLRVQLINNRKVLIIPLVPVFHKSSCCLMRSYEQTLSSLTLLRDTETEASQPKPSTLRQLKFPCIIGSWKAALSWFIPLLYSKFW